MYFIFRQMHSFSEGYSLADILQKMESINMMTYKECKTKMLAFAV